MPDQRTRRIAGLVLLSLLVALAVDLFVFARQLLPSPRNLDELPRVDVIVVLTGGRGRLKEAIALLAQGKSDRLFISGVEPGTSLPHILRANQITDVPEDLEPKITLGMRSRTTSENALEVSDLVASTATRSLLLVTSTYHMRRARQLVEKAFDARGFKRPQIVDFPVESPNFGRERWWRSSTGWQVFVSEYFKTWAVRLGILTS